MFIDFVLPFYDIKQIESEFLEQLKSTIARLLDISKPFVQTEAEDLCEYCDFKEICKR